MQHVGQAEGHRGGGDRGHRIQACRGAVEEWVLRVRVERVELLRVRAADEHRRLERRRGPHRTTGCCHVDFVSGYLHGRGEVERAMLGVCGNGGYHLATLEFRIREARHFRSEDQCDIAGLREAQRFGRRRTHRHHGARKLAWSCR